MTVPKIIRYKVFHRDKFTCQYCGRTPPEVTLEIGYKIPKSEGEDEDISNLVTVCHKCNINNKGKKITKNIFKANNLDIEYLEAEQRLAEMKKYKEIKEKLEEETIETISDLQEFFCEQMRTSWIVEHQSIRWLLYFHDPSEIEKAIVFASVQAKDRMPSDQWRYACGILRNWRQEQNIRE